VEEEDGVTGEEIADIITDIEEVVVAAEEEEVINTGPIKGTTKGITKVTAVTEEVAVIIEAAVRRRVVTIIKVTKQVEVVVLEVVTETLGNKRLERLEKKR
jgi:hypothetical protein